eukprot:TRINITY_DN7557_c0_g1_i2.p1 TRINITY_DN7557_c0_g1~~TRINITY_DN7557_c0_g1_i2.p1  ORF type:complete len:631 (+),score=133.00 TRINITY_DN7557_c0_g1_i2:1-1893(+)
MSEPIPTAPDESEDVESGVPPPDHEQDVLEEEGSFLSRLISPERRQRRPFWDLCHTSRCVRSSVVVFGAGCLILTIIIVSLFLSSESTHPSEPAEYSVNAPLYLLNQITDQSMRQHIQYLSSDLLEGRGTATKGETLATQYIASHFSTAGLQPLGDSNTYFQAVHLTGRTPQNVSSLLFRFSPPDSAPTDLSFRFLDDFTIGSDLYNTSILGAPVVFIGYGIQTNLYGGWDDYKNLNARGKILIALVNDPPCDTELDIFECEALTYYGRWVYKFEQAQRMGALGMFLVHTDSSAGYGWQVVRNSWGSEQVFLRTPPKSPLNLRGWITQATAESLAAAAGTSLAAWQSAAASRSFQPQALPYTATASATYVMRAMDGTNVIGGIIADRNAETVMVMGHHDHLGMRPGTPNVIYHGAVDNASGIGALLSCAYAFGRMYTSIASVASPLLEVASLKRNIIFVSTTAEEAGLLGAAFLMDNPPVVYLDPSNIVGAVNFDVMNVYGRTRDIVMIGQHMSSQMDQIIQDAADRENMALTQDPSPQQGHFFRSDQLPLFLKNITGVNPSSGMAFIGKPNPAYFMNVTTDFNENRYHQPGDVYDPSWDLGGALQQVRVGARIVYTLANSDIRPTLNNG